PARSLVESRIALYGQLTLPAAFFQPRIADSLPPSLASAFCVDLLILSCVRELHLRLNGTSAPGRAVALGAAGARGPELPEGAGTAVRRPTETVSSDQRGTRQLSTGPAASSGRLDPGGSGRRTWFGGPAADASPRTGPNAAARRTAVVR